MNPTFIPQVCGCTRARLVEELPAFRATVGQPARPALIVQADPKPWDIPVDRDLYAESVSVADTEAVLQAFDRDGRVVLRPDFAAHLHATPVPTAALSCALSDAVHIKEIFDRYGVVVVENVITPTECARSVDEIWKVLCDLSPLLVRADTSTWEHWATGHRMGLIGMGSVRFLEPQACLNRVKTYDAFRAVLGEDELIASMITLALHTHIRAVYAVHSITTPHATTHHHTSPYINHTTRHHTTTTPPDIALTRSSS